MVFKKTATAVIATALMAITAGTATAADNLSFVSWGGTTQEAQKQAWAAPFSEATGIRVEPAVIEFDAPKAKQSTKVIATYSDGSERDVTRWSLFLSSNDGVVGIDDDGTGFVAFEVGEVRHGRVRLEEEALPCGAAAGFEPLLVLINSQDFTKTARVWGVDNGRKGTNTNRVVLFRKPA